MKLITGMATLLFLLIAVEPVHADKLRIAVSADNPPFIMKNDKGQLSGFEIEIAYALCYFMQAECKFMEQPRQDLINGLVDKKYDAVMAMLPVSDEFDDRVAFSEHYYSRYLHFIAKKDSDLEFTAAALKGKKLGVQASANGAAYLQEKYPDSAIIKSYDGIDAVFEALKKSELDAVLVDAYHGYNWLLQTDNSDYDLVGEKVDIAERVGIAIRRTDSSLQADLISALETIRSNGTYTRINRNYFPYDVY